jgi:O-acetyl-ADP-ribose deacetylase (regulator of RNase III)
MYEKKIQDHVIRLVKQDITDYEVEAFVYYARPDLKLGTGWGGAISVRGGPSIQKELDEIGSCEVGKAVVTGAGEMKAQHIIHAVGPAFQEEDEERKLRDTVRSTLALADEKGFARVAYPPMGSGFYGIPLDVSARIMLDELQRHLQGESKLQEVIICVNDNRELKPFRAQLEALA